MSRTIQTLGSAPTSAPRVLTFGSDWSKFDEACPDRGFPWQYAGTGPSSYVPQDSGQQTTQNEEEQYYIKQHELLSPSSAVLWDNGKPWNVNDDGHMVLRGIPTPAAYADIAYVVINGYEVVSSTSTEIRVKGQGYYDRSTGTSRVGLNKYERGLYTGQPLRVKVGNTTYDINNIIDESGGTDPTSGTTYHRIQVSSLTGGQPSAGNFVNVLRPTEFVSGMFTTRGTHSQKYGSWEMRAKFPSGRGAFPALWSWPNYNEYSGAGFQTADKNVEIDFIECLGHAPDIWYHNAHQPSPYSTLLPDKSGGGKTMKGYVNHAGLTPFYSGDEWTNDAIQQHQVLIGPTSDDYINGATEFITCRWDWYTNNTAAWFVKKDSWSDFRKVADMHMSPHSFNNVIDARCWFVNNAINGSFNVSQEVNDANYPRFVNTRPAVYDFEIDYLRTYQWTGETNGGAGFPNGSGIYPTGFTATPGNGEGTSSGNGTTTGDGGTGGGTTTTTASRKAPFIEYAPDMANGQIHSASAVLPVKADGTASSPDEYTFSWAAGAGVTLLGATDQHQVEYILDDIADGAVASRQLFLNYQLIGVDEETIPKITSITVSGGYRIKD